MNRWLIRIHQVKSSDFAQLIISVTKQTSNNRPKQKIIQQMKRHLTVLAMLLGLLFSLTSCQKPPPTTISYSNCSSDYCISCLTPYLCSQCSYNDQPSCCPKYCSKCLNMKICIECEPHFILTSVNKTFVVCTRVYNSTDPYGSSSYTSTCINGYYFEPVTSSCYSCNVSNCQACSSYQACTACNKQYFLYNSTTTNSVNQTVYLQICQPCIANCLTCSNATSCTTCLPQYFSTTFACEPCLTAYCVTCANNGATCQTCIAGAFLNSTSNKCILCSYTINNCTKCSLINNIPTCTLCATGFYLNSSQICQLCPANCISCQLIGSFLNCTVCDDGYVYDTGSKQCISCGLGCGNCSYVNSTFNNCSYCLSGFAPMWNSNTNSSVCVGCQYPCLSCTNDSICYQCEIGFYVNYVVSPNLKVGQCYLCNIENCVACSSAKNCTDCEDGYYAKLVAGSNSYGCSQCPGQCSKCSVTNITANTAPVCSLCAIGFTLQKNNCAKCSLPNCMICSPTSLSQCLQCMDGHLLIQNLTCITCNAANCRVCQAGYNASDNCMECILSYYLVENQATGSYYCMPCGQNCFNCTSESYCLECLEGYYLVQGSSKTAVCQACPVECLTCNNQQQCLFCAEGYYPATQQNTFYNQTTSVKCSPCSTIQGCVSCFSSVFCRQCTPNGYSVLPDTTGSCIPCGYGCVACDNQQACSACEDGFLLNTQTNECMDVAGVPAWGIFVILTFGFALIFVLIEKVIRRIMRKKKIKKGENQILLQIPYSQRPFQEMGDRSVSQQISFKNQRFTAFY